MASPNPGRTDSIPAAVQVSVSTFIDRPREDVYALVDDLSAHERWTDHYITEWEVDGNTARVKIGSGRSEIRVVSSTPDAIVEEGHDGKRRTRGTYRLSELGPDRTEVTFVNEVLERGARYEVLGEPLVKLYLKRNNAKALARLKAILEGR